MIRVNRQDLIEKITASRDEHKSIFDQAQVEYRKKVIEVLDRRLKAARDGGKINTYIQLPEPVDYSARFDEVLEQLRWDTRDEIDLPPIDFNRFVLNQWEWRQEFAANTASYVAS